MAGTQQGWGIGGRDNVIQGGACWVTLTWQTSSGILDSSLQRGIVVSLMESSLRSQEHRGGKSPQTTLQRTPQNPKASHPRSRREEGQVFTFVEGIIWVMDGRPLPQKIMQTSAFNLSRVRYSAGMTQSSTLGRMLLWTAACLCTSGF